MMSMFLSMFLMVAVFLPVSFLVAVVVFLPVVALVFFLVAALFTFLKESFLGMAIMMLSTLNKDIYESNAYDIISTNTFLLAPFL